MCSLPDPSICEAACDSDPKCVAWTYVVRPPLTGSCCLKDVVPAQNPNPTCTSGVKNAPAGTTAALFGDTRMSSLNRSDGHAANVVTSAPWPIGTSEGFVEVPLQVFVDASVVEVFGASGRATITRRAYPTLDDANGVELYAVGGPCAFATLQVSLMSPI